MAQAILGIYPFAHAHLLALVRPTLPAWLTSVTVHNLRVGAARVSIRFRRSAEGATTYQVVEQAGTLHVLDVPPPQDEEPDRQHWRDVVSTWLLDHAAGRTAAALRIALGKDV